jgi:hypothetical protein
MMAEMYESRFGTLDSSKFKSIVALGGVHGCWMFLGENKEDEEEDVASLLLAVRNLSIQSNFGRAGVGRPRAKM